MWVRDGNGVVRLFHGVGNRAGWGGVERPLALR